ncbi:MAG TPA: nickel pincer cofactor biosynthesis protein LarC, partial [Deltaproteobacteria bacterium]|nr:nickel pincer cofactor biosynthesis protein LarC [Deltaproteobacteria bacterium]
MPNQHLHLDCYSGVSGDMFLGALVDAGVSVEELEQGQQSLRVDGWRLERGAERDSRIGGTRLHVHLDHGHDHHHRRLPDILKLIEEAAGLSPEVKTRASAVFRTLAQAEAEVHGLAIDEVHFHEVGAVDAIVDVVGVVLGLELLGVDSVSSSPLALGSGVVKCAHGTVPVPAPATALLLRGLPTYAAAGEHPTGELVTPTGAALVRTLASDFGKAPAMTLLGVAYGLGSRDRGPIPNALRLLVGRCAAPSEEAPGSLIGLADEQVEVLTTTLDDMDSRLCGPLIEGLLLDGALDATLRSVYAKKGRPAIELVVLCPPNDEVMARIEERVFRETTTLGVRWRAERRSVLE